jgi:hypothetical protein
MAIMDHYMTYSPLQMIVIVLLLKSSQAQGNPLVPTRSHESLFHAVVDTEETARKILEVLIKEKAGRITFIPLNSVRVKPVKYPVGEDGQPLKEAVPILERIKVVDPKFQKAVDSVIPPSSHFSNQYRYTVGRLCVHG